MGNVDRDHRRRVYEAVKRAIGDVTLTENEYAQIRSWASRELTHLYSAGQTSYIVFGSYRGDYLRRLRIVQYELSKPTTATADILGDVPDIGISYRDGQADPLEFNIKFELLTEFANQNVGVYEKDSGGEAVELRALADEYRFEYTWVLPRDFYGAGGRVPETVEELHEQARHIAFADDIENDKRVRELRGLLEEAQDNGVDVTEHELKQFLASELASKSGADPEYSWVHLAIFRKFERAGRCITWHTEEDLRDAAHKLTSSPR